MSAIIGDSADDATPAVEGRHSGKGNGVIGRSVGWQGVLGTSVEQAGTVGVSDKFVGVWGESHGEGFPGVLGISDLWAGVVGESRSTTQSGVWGKGSSWQGVLGTSVDQAGVVGTSDNFVGVWAESRAAGQAALFAVAKSPEGLAGRFEGDVEVTGDVRLANADGAELFDVVAVDEISPGMVVVIDEDGAIDSASQEYDRRVVGIVSGAGSYRPGLVLDCQVGNAGRLPVAVFGKVYCKVDARTEPVSAGDLLCSSALRGVAMRASDSGRAFGAVVGKALAPLAGCVGLVPVLVALQ